jgi:hypothetical protein
MEPPLQPLSVVVIVPASSDIRSSEHAVRFVALGFMRLLRCCHGGRPLECHARLEVPRWNVHSSLRMGSVGSWVACFITRSPAA